MSWCLGAQRRALGERMGSIIGVESFEFGAVGHAELSRGAIQTDVEYGFFLSLI